MLRTFKLRLGVVIIDTVAAAFDLDDEDDNSEAAKVIRKMRAISDVTDTLVVPVHHYGKSPKTGLRGASGWRAGCDAVISCIADRDEISGVVSGHELALAKSRQHQEGPVAPFELAFESLGVDPDGDEFGSLYVIPLLDRPSKIAGTITTKREPQSLTVFRAAFTDVMAVGGGQTIKVGGNGPAVFAARVSDVRAEFDRRYPTGDVDPQKVNNALASAFRRGLREATSREYANECRISPLRTSRFPKFRTTR
jgi:AAA domain